MCVTVITFNCFSVKIDSLVLTVHAAIVGLTIGPNALMRKSRVRSGGCILHIWLENAYSCSQIFGFWEI